MAKIIIEGREEEICKVQSSLNNLFSKVKKLAQFNVGDVKSVVFEVVQEKVGDLINGFTEDEINLALSCHASKERNCEKCPYRKIKNCITQVQIDGALMIKKIQRKQLNVESGNE